MARYISLRTPMTTASVIVAVLPLTTLLLGAVASSSIRLILWRARMIAQSLDDADIIIRHLLWNTETMMVNNYCNNNKNELLHHHLLCIVIYYFNLRISDSFSFYYYLTPFIPCLSRHTPSKRPYEVRLLR